LQVAWFGDCSGTAKLDVKLNPRPSTERKTKQIQGIAAKLIIGLAIKAIGMFAADTSVGSWKFNPAKSSPTNANEFKSRTDVREATPRGGVKVARTEQSTSGATSEATYTYNYDGKTLTQSFKGTDADGKAVHGTNVYDRQ
jgi:hypothetical protein